MPIYSWVAGLGEGLGSLGQGQGERSQQEQSWHGFMWGFRRGFRWFRVEINGLDNLDGVLSGLYEGLGEAFGNAGFRVIV